MSDASDVLLIGFDSQQQANPNTGYRIFGGSNFVRVDDACNLASALSEGDFHLAVIGNPIEWADCSAVVQEIRDEMPGCFVLIMSNANSDKFARDATQLGLVEYTLPDLAPTSLSQNSPVPNAENQAQSVGPCLLKATDNDPRFQFLLSNVGVGVFCCATDGRVLRMNQAFRQMMDGFFGLASTPSESQDLALVSSDLKSFLREVAESSGVCHAELALTQVCSETRFFRFHARRLAAAGQPVRIEGLVEDISNQKLAETLKQQAVVAQERLSRLSQQERKIMGEVVAGAMNKSIARRFDISEKTVERHRSNLMKKLQVSSVAELVHLSDMANPTRSLGDSQDL